MTGLLAQGGLLSDVAALFTATAGLIAAVVAGWKFLDERRKRKEAETQQKEAEQREHAAEQREKEAEARNAVLEEAIGALQASIADLQAPTQMEENQVDPKLAQQLVAAVNQLTSAVKQLQGDVSNLKKQQEAINEKLEKTSSPQPTDIGDFEDIGIGTEDTDLEDLGGQTFGMEEAKRAYLVGSEPKAKKVYILIKVHDFRGKAIYRYDLISGTGTKEADSSTPDIDARIARYREIGHKIKHRGDLPFGATAKWIAHARAEAQRLGLTVGR